MCTALVKGIDATNVRAASPWTHQTTWWATPAAEPESPIPTNTFMRTQPTGDQPAQDGLCLCEGEALEQEAGQGESHERRDEDPSPVR